jgi:hypothetical protein
MNNVIKFPTIKKQEERDVESEKDSYLDDSVEFFIINSFETFNKLDPNQLQLEEEKAQKMFAFLREAMKATLDMFHKEQHPMHGMAEDCIQFIDSPREQTIDLNGV